MTTAARAATAGLTPRNRALKLLAQLWSWLFLLALIIFFSATGQGFLSVRNFGNILVASTLVMLMAIGQTYVIVTGGIDLSIGWTVGLASVISATTMRNLANGGMDVSLSITLGVFAGLAVALIPGIINGALITRVKVPPFIATLGMFGIVRGAAFLLTDGQNVVGDLPAALRDSLRAIGNGSLLYSLPDTGQLYWFSLPAEVTGQQLRIVQRLLPYPVLFVVLMLIIFGFVLARTQFGRHTYAIGGNAEAARRAGINVTRHLTWVYILAALTAGMAGVLHVFRFTAGSPNAGESALLDSVAAVVIGGTSLFGGEGKLSGTVVGSLIIAVLQTGLVILAIDGLWQFIVVGCVIIIAVLVNQAQELIMRRQESALHGR
ncbi:MAG: ABC transporter permease [Chloroflexota bacterium]|nr:ABC transporter permease [Chloroflexota bacterium]